MSDLIDVEVVFATASKQALIAVRVAGEQHGAELDFSPDSLEALDEAIESMREEGLDGEEAAEVLFVFGCYLGEVMARHLRGRWTPTARSPLKDLSPWPMVVTLADGSAWDTIGKVYKRLELGDSEFLPAFYQWAAGGRTGGARG